LRSLIFCTTTPECSSVDVDHDLLDRLQPLAGSGRLSFSTTRGRDTDNSKAFAAHGLDQGSQAAIRRGRRTSMESLSEAFRHAQRDIALGLAPTGGRGSCGS